MLVLELTQLRLLKGLSATDPVLLHSLSLVRESLQTKSRFYRCIEDPTLIYILGLWPSLAAHQHFLASPQRDQVLGPQEDMLQFCWTVHMELDQMASLPLDAPVLAIQRWDVCGDYVDAFNQAATKHLRLLEESHSFKVRRGWRCDAPTGSHEALIFSGWDNAQAHAAFAKKQKSHNDNTLAVINGQHEQILLHHAADLERINS